MTNITSIIKDSFQEYEHHHSIVLFVGGCNFKCKDCYNYEKANGEVIGNAIDILEENINDLHDAIVFLGGEPTIWGGSLIEDLRFIRKKYPNLKIKIFTNGTQPDVIRAINKKRLVDAYSIDVKAVTGDAKKILGSKFSIECYLQRLDKSIKSIESIGIELELRTTKHEFIEVDKVIEYVNEKWSNIKHILQEPFEHR